MNRVHPLHADPLHDRPFHHLPDRRFFRRACAACHPAQGQVGRETALFGRKAQGRDVSLDSSLQGSEALSPQIAHCDPDHARPAQTRETTAALDRDVEGRESRAGRSQRICHLAHPAHGRVAQELERQVHGVGRDPFDAAMRRLALEFALDATDRIAHRLVQLDRNEGPQCQFRHIRP